MISRIWQVLQQRFCTCFLCRGGMGRVTSLLQKERGKKKQRGEKAKIKEYKKKKKRRKKVEKKTQTSIRAGEETGVVIYSGSGRRGGKNGQREKLDAATITHRDSCPHRSCQNRYRDDSKFILR